MLQKKISLPLAMLITLIGIIVTGLLSFRYQKNNETPENDETITKACPTDVKRLDGYAYIRPLLFADRECQSDKLGEIRNQVEGLINSYKQSTTITTASVYLRQLNQGDYISIGESETYNPGSLLKVPELITFFKMNETTPGLLDRPVTYDKALNLPKQAYFLSKSIEVGKTYTIRELLYYMIAYSDNNATMLLNQRMDLAEFQKVFTDLGLPKPDVKSNDVPVTAKDYSYFMRVLYNASYLNIKDSEYCTELLSHCDFTIGLVSGLPKNIKVAHKFGEAGDAAHIAHLGESAIVYLNNSPYLLTVMIKGKDNKQLPAVISAISKKIFEMIGLV